MELGHLLIRSGLTYPEVSSKVNHDSVCQLGSSVSLPWVMKYYMLVQRLKVAILPLELPCSGPVTPFRGNFNHWQVSPDKIRQEISAVVQSYWDTDSNT